jgi:hypothetical protein
MMLRQAHHQPWVEQRWRDATVSSGPVDDRYQPEETDFFRNCYLIRYSKVVMSGKCRKLSSHVVRASGVVLAQSWHRIERRRNTENGCSRETASPGRPAHTNY